MIDLQQIEYFYQQWIQGNESYMHQQRDFIKMVCKVYCINEDELKKKLSSCAWWTNPK